MISQPMTGKSAEEIMGLLPETVTVVSRLQSIYNFKAKEQVQSYKR